MPAYASPTMDIILPVALLAPQWHKRIQVQVPNVFFARPIDGSTTNYLGSQREMDRTMSWTCVRDWASQIGWTTLVRRGAPGVHVIVERISAVT